MFQYKNQDILDYTEDFKNNLERFSKFIVLIYIPYWFKVSLSADAAVIDLDLYHKLLQYSAIDQEICTVVLQVLHRHLWYLCPDSVILWSLFGTSLCDDEKSRIASVLLTKPHPKNFEPKKVKFPILTPATKIEHLITPISWFPFTLLGLSHEWLKTPPSEWDNNSDFKEMKDFAQNVKLTNDVAERGVKLVSDYSDILTTDSEERKRLVLAVQSHRREYSKMRKKDLVRRIGENNNEKMENNSDDQNFDEGSLEGFDTEGDSEDFDE